MHLPINEEIGPRIAYKAIEFTPYSTPRHTYKRFIEDPRGIIYQYNQNQ